MDKNKMKLVLAVVLLAIAGVAIAYQMGVFGQKKPPTSTSGNDGGAAATDAGAGEGSTTERGTTIKKPKFD